MKTKANNIVVVEVDGFKSIDDVQIIANARNDLYGIKTIIGNFSLKSRN